MTWDDLMILGDRIPSPRIIHTKVTIEPHFVLKSGIKDSQKILGVRAMDVLCATRPRLHGSELGNLAPPLIKRGTFCQPDISGAILYCLSAILGLADQVFVS